MSAIALTRRVVPPRETVGRMVRCFSVSCLTTVISLTALAVLTASFGVVAWVANVAAMAIGTVPSYLLNRRWVWQKHGAGSMTREVGPFWLLSAAGLALSTVAVAVTDAWATASGITGTALTVAVLAANLAAYAGLWLVQFVLLERIIFATESS